MMGLIWFIQVVHYPLHAHVGAEQFSNYQHLHMNWTTFVVGPPMLIEMVTTVFFLITPPLHVPYWMLVIGAFFLSMIWGSTIIFQVPFHSTLTKSFEVNTHKKLVMSNWIRTFFWSCRGILVLYMTSILLKKITI